MKNGEEMLQNERNIKIGIMFGYFNDYTYRFLIKECDLNSTTHALEKIGKDGRSNTIHLETSLRLKT